MRCDDCGSAEATILIGHPGSLPSRLRLCADCASRRGVSGSGGVLSIDLGALFATAEPGPGSRIRSCAACGLSFDDFLREGRFGCPACVQAFADAYPPLAKRPAFAGSAPGSSGSAS